MPPSSLLALSALLNQFAAHYRNTGDRAAANMAESLAVIATREAGGKIAHADRGLSLADLKELDSHRYEMNRLMLSQAGVAGF